MSSRCKFEVLITFLKRNFKYLGQGLNISPPKGPGFIQHLCGSLVPRDLRTEILCICKMFSMQVICCMHISLLFSRYFLKVTENFSLLSWKVYTAQFICSYAVSVSCSFLYIVSGTKSRTYFNCWGCQNTSH